METEKLLSSTFLCSIYKRETVSHACQTNPSPATGNVIQPRAAFPPYYQYTSYKTKGSFSNIYIHILKTYSWQWPYKHFPNLNEGNCVKFQCTIACTHFHLNPQKYKMVENSACS